LKNTFKGSAADDVVVAATAAVAVVVAGRSTTQFIFAYPLLRVTMSVSGSTFGHSLVKKMLMISLMAALVGVSPFEGIETGTLVQGIILL
jgi:hypothetical protein